MMYNVHCTIYNVHCTMYNVHSSKKSLAAKIIIEVGLVFIYTVGFCGNAIAIYIISSNNAVRQSRSYILLVNQYLLDVVFNIIPGMSIATRYLQKIFERTY